ARSEFRGYEWKRIDTAMLLWGFFGTVAYILLHKNGGAVVYRLGWLFDGMGMYFLFRCLIHDWKDFEGIVTTFLVLSIPVAFFFAIENLTRRNFFSLFGGVPAITIEREGKLRCQGAFAHPILAGCFWVGVLPWLATRWWEGAIGKMQALVGVFLATVIAFFAASSTPIAGLGAAMIAGLVFVLRRHMRKIRWGILFTLVGLHIVMKAPVWHLLARANIVGGSTGWHRYALVDAAIRNFREWFLLGTPSTGHWGRQLFDVTNEYVLQGVRGGVLTLIFFIAAMSYAYQGVGRMTRLFEGHRARQYKAWALGASLFAHTMMFLAVSYFGQILSLWFLQLAIIGSLAPKHPVLAPPTAELASSENERREEEEIEAKAPRGPARAGRRLARIRY
ncbi:MAG TPA: hypothetical protein VK116_01570, partial [Planctomycetota bacterium]|nr:hypothetical protein [Planctomycetota bacterium]